MIPLLKVLVSEQEPIAYVRTCIFPKIAFPPLAKRHILVIIWFVVQDRRLSMIFPVTVSSSMLLSSVLALSLVLFVLVYATIEHFMSLASQKMVSFPKWKILEVDRIVVAWI